MKQHGIDYYKSRNIVHSLLYSFSDDTFQSLKGSLMTYANLFMICYEIFI
jgi:hypothetical protein